MNNEQNSQIAQIPPCFIHNVGGSVLLKVPENQIKWFNDTYWDVSNDKFPTDGADWDMLKSNIFGINDRFLNHNSDNQGLLDGFWLGYSSGGHSTIYTRYFLGLIFGCAKCAIDFEYYELAGNAIFVYNSIVRHILKNEKEYHNYIYVSNKSF